MNATELPQTQSKEITELLHQLFRLYLSDPPDELPVDFLQFSHFFEITQKIIQGFEQNPIKFIKQQEAFFLKQSELFLNTVNRMTCIPELINNTVMNKDRKKTYFEPENDMRFKSESWDLHPGFQFLKQFYYITTEHTLQWLRSLDTLDPKTQQQMHFYVKNYLDLLSPSNFVNLNPEVLQNFLESGGESLLHGYKNFLKDLLMNKGRLNISKTDFNAFQVGKNLGITPGKIIFQNEMMQLIQYSPTTHEVYRTPILFIPPWINKYYVLDLSPENSLVKWLVDQGFTVYMISWVNPGIELAHKKFEDYMHEGPLAALSVIQKSAKVDAAHMVGYCIGGTLLGCTLAYMQKKRDRRVASASFFMSLLDFSDPGEIGVFIDEKQLKGLDKAIDAKGYLDGKILDAAFSMLRPNDLIWPYFINNYLQGKTPRPFDLLYWNGDSTNLPKEMYSFYIRKMYLQNQLKKRGGIKLFDVPIDLKSVTVPSFFLASESDHITLWKSVYASLKLLGGTERFVLSESGHVRGVINPPAKNKYSFYVNKRYENGTQFPENPEDWLADAESRKGSWWPYFAEWLAIDAEKVPAETRDPRTSGFPILEDAPGSYVMRRI